MSEARELSLPVTTIWGSKQNAKYEPEKGRETAFLEIALFIFNTVISHKLPQSFNAQRKLFDVHSMLLNAYYLENEL